MPRFHGMMDAPSGLGPPSQSPAGSFADWFLVRIIDLQTTSLMMLCRACLSAPDLQASSCNPSVSTTSPRPIDNLAVSDNIPKRCPILRTLLHLIITECWKQRHIYQDTKKATPRIQRISTLSHYSRYSTKYLQLS